MASLDNYQGHGATYVQLDTSVSGITGMVAIANGHMCVIQNKTGGTITINHQDTASAAENRFLMSTGANLSLTDGQRVLFVYSSGASRWVNVLPVF